MPLVFETFPVLHTPRLDFIEITSDHIPDLYRLFTDKRVTEYYPVIPLKVEADAQKIVTMLNRRYTDGQGIRWGIALKGQQEIIGNLGFNSFTHGHKGTIVFSLLPEYWGKGIVTEAITELIRFGFNKLNLTRIDAEVQPGNTASEKVLAKLHFRHEGLLHQWMHWGDKLYDINMYALLNR